MDYHLLKRKNKGGSVYHVAFLSDDPKKKYRCIKSTNTGNKSLAHKIARKMIGDGQVTTSKDSLEDFLLTFWDSEKSEYLRSCKAEGRTHSVLYLSLNSSIIKRYFLPYFSEHGIIKLSQLTRQNLLAWRNSLFESGTGPRTINRVRTAVWTALSWGVEMDLLPHHPGSGVRPVKDKPAERQIFELSELEKLFSSPWQDFRSFACCMLAASTGMRIGECRGLLIQNLHLNEGYLDVITNFQDEEGLKPPKWDSQRIGVPLPSRTIEALKKVLQLRRDSPFVFFSTESPDKPMSKHTIGRALSTACKNAGIPVRPFHSFRHSFVSHSSSLSPAALRGFIGHTNPETTERYQHVTEADRKALEDVQARILPFKVAK